MRRLAWGLAGLGLVAVPAANAWYTPLPNARNGGCFSFTTWTARDSNRAWRSMAASEDGTKMITAVNNTGNVYISTDSGATWTAKTAAGSHVWNGVAASRNFDTLVAMDKGGTGKVSVSVDGGTTWTAYDIARNWYRVAMSQDGNIMYGIIEFGTTSKMYKSTDMGLTWALLANSASTTWNSIATSADGKIVLGGSSVTGASVYVSTDGGATWATKAVSGPSGAAGMSADGKIMMIGQYGGKIAISTNTGSTWTSTTSVTAQWNDLTMSPDGTKIIAAPNNNFLQTSADGGTTWANNSINTTWISAAMSEDGSVVAANVNGGQIYTSSCKAINH